MKAENFFSSSEKEKIAAAIGEVEKTTAGEIAVMVVDQSDSYPEGNILAGLIPGCLMAYVLTQFSFGDSLTYFLLLLAGFLPWPRSVKQSNCHRCFNGRVGFVAHQFKIIKGKIKHGFDFRI